MCCNCFLTQYVTAGFPAETYLGSRMRGGGLFERWPRGHRVKTSVMSRFPQFFRSVLVQIVSVFPEFYRCNIVASLWVMLMAFCGLNVQFKVDLYMVCHRSQLHSTSFIVSCTTDDGWCFIRNMFWLKKNFKNIVWFIKAIYYSCAATEP